MKLLFVVMPWHSLDYPCLAAGILESVAREKAKDWVVEQRYANVEWSAFLNEATDGAFGPLDYNLLSEEFVFNLAGEWVFSSALHGRVNHNVRQFREVFQGTDVQFEKILLAHQHARAFIDKLAADIIRECPDVVALSTTFTQNVACLALAQAIKAASASTITIMGGGNCDGPQGVALHRNFSFVDFVVRGEGETSFAELLATLGRKNANCEHIGGLCWRRDGICQVNPVGGTERIEDVPTPAYDSYFRQINASSIRSFIEPALVMETARGCWWGEKHHCTFCGLNGTSMAFRSKSPEKAFNELLELVCRHKVLDVVVADNILDNSYFDTVLPRVAAADMDLRIHYEIKANLKQSQIRLMNAAGVLHVQPGIESLSSRVLQLMEKGITGPRNVQSLRDCEEANLTVSWNYLVGFPGETMSDYDGVICQLKNLHHLQPPTGASRIVLERFSPYFNKPSLGFVDRRPHTSYGLIYDLAPAELENFAFFFSAPAAGIDEAKRLELDEGIATWRNAYRAGSQLWHVEVDEGVEINDLRCANSPKLFLIEDEPRRNVQIALRTSRSLVSICEHVARETGHSEAEVRVAIDWFKDRGLVFEDGGQLVGLSTGPIPFRARPESGLPNQPHRLPRP